MFGSDHRPVMRSITVHNFGQPQFADLQKLLATNNPIQGYGQIDIQLVQIRKLKLGKISKMNKFDFSDINSDLQLRLSFFDAAIDKISCPINFSQET